MGIIVKKPGLFTTVQDIGRRGYQDLGFSPSGVMDRRAFRIANLLIDNNINEAVLEATMTGPTLQFTTRSIIAITGGDFGPKINGKPVPMYTALLIKKGDILSFGAAKTGSRTYIAFAGGLAIEPVMGSKSTLTKCKIGGFRGRRLMENDYIGFICAKSYLPNFLSRTLPLHEYEDSEVTLRVVLGPQEDYFTKQGIRTFLKSTYQVTNDFDRMGCRLDGPSIEHKQGADIISDGIALGAIQVPAHGKPIIMLADRQTTGGYAKIATVISSDIPKLVQRKFGDQVHFEVISIREAQRIYKDEFKEMAKLNAKIHQPCPEILEPRPVARRVASLLK